MNKMISLFNTTYAANGNEKLVFKQYKLFVEMADKIVHRRSIINSFFLSINAALISLVSYSEPSNSHIYLLNMAGLALSIPWFNVIKSYKNLSRAKYQLIYLIEEKLPLMPYSMEWKKLTGKLATKKYRKISNIESWVPGIFAVLYTLPLFECVFHKLF